VSRPARNLISLPKGRDILIDANIFIYAFTDRSSECRWLLDQCGAEQIGGATTIEILNEVCHRLMLVEAVTAGIINRPSALSLKRKPDAVKSLGRYWRLTESLFHLNLLIIPLDETRRRQAADIRLEYGLLTTDSMLIAAAHDYKISSIASHDSDFERIQEFTIYRPSDVR
jgi:predicted nucleic acid-binding protein